MRLRLALLLASLAALPSVARADEPPPFTDVGALGPPAPEARPPAAAVPTLDAFSYVRPQEKHYLRGAFEVGTVLIVGNIDYLQNTGARGGRFAPATSGGTSVTTGRSSAPS